MIRHIVLVRFRADVASAEIAAIGADLRPWSGGWTASLPATAAPT